MAVAPNENPDLYHIKLKLDDSLAFWFCEVRKS
jgi:hypothetical protein